MIERVASEADFAGSWVTWTNSCAKAAMLPLWMRSTHPWGASMASVKMRSGWLPGLTQARCAAPRASSSAWAGLEVAGGSVDKEPDVFCRSGGSRGRGLGDGSGEVFSVVLEVAVSRSCLLRPLFRRRSALRLDMDVEEAGVAGTLRTMLAGKMALTSSETLLGGL